MYLYVCPRKAAMSTEIIISFQSNFFKKKLYIYLKIIKNPAHFTHTRQENLSFSNGSSVPLALSLYMDVWMYSGGKDSSLFFFIFI